MALERRQALNYSRAGIRTTALILEPYGQVAVAAFISGSEPTLQAQSATRPGRDESQLPAIKEFSELSVTDRCEGLPYEEEKGLFSY